MNFEGGVGGDFLKGGLTAGLAYYATFKISDDQNRRVSARSSFEARTRRLVLAPKQRWRSPEEYRVRLPSRRLLLGNLRADNDAGERAVHSGHVPDQAAQDTAARAVSAVHMQEASMADQKKPNILVIWGDDIGITNLSCYTPRSDGIPRRRTSIGSPRKG